MMRLLKRAQDDSLELISVDDDQPPPYAVLSHTWSEGEEVTYDELVAGTGKDKTAYAKILFCLDRAAEDGIEYCWVDTCCINKSSNEELQSTMNTMFRWYQGAARCYAYPSDVRVPKDVSNPETLPMSREESFRQSRWFTRGWTLQELRAPTSVEFFSEEGKLLGDKMTLEREICDVTKIPVKALRGSPLSAFSTEERMSWAAARTTTLAEDKTYSLLGISEINLPLIYGEGGANAGPRLLDAIQSREESRAIERLMKDLAVSPFIPLPRDEVFTGREDELQWLDEFLNSNVHRCMTICGLGGCGKSALAIEFAYRALSQRQGRLVFWVPAISHETFELAYRAIGARLCIPGINEDNADIKGLVKDALESTISHEWIMIVDGVDDPQIFMASDTREARLVEYLPRSDKGKIVFTTRNRNITGDLTRNNKLELNEIGKAEARQLLWRRIKNQALLDNANAIDELLELLAYLPLAIVQAAAFIDKNDIAISKYFSLFWNSGNEAELSGNHFEDPGRYQGLDSTIGKTLHKSFDKIREQDVLAAEYLSFMACIDCIDIPLSLLPPGSSPLQRAKAIHTLKGYALITERQQATSGPVSDRFFDVHRLVHMAVAQWLDGQDLKKIWVAKVTARLGELLPYLGHETKDILTKYLSHANHVARLAARYQTSPGLYPEVESPHQAISALRMMLTMEKERRFSGMGEIGVGMGSQFQYEEGEPMYSPDVQKRLNKWAGERNPERNPRKAVTVNETLAEDHSVRLASERELAEAYLANGQIKEAVELLEHVVVVQEKVLADEHPVRLASIRELARTYRANGQIERAIELLEHVAVVQKKVLAEDHPTRLATKCELARTYRANGQIERAVEQLEHVALVQMKVLAEDNPIRLATERELAGAYLAHGQIEEAVELLERVVGVQKKVLAEDHPVRLASEYELATIYRASGRMEEAVVLLEHAVIVQKRVLAEDDLVRLASEHELAITYRAGGRIKEAVGLLEHAVIVQKRVLAEDHPVRLASIRELAGAYLAHGQIEEAAEILEHEDSMIRESLAIFERALGSEHPETLNMMSYLADILDLQGKPMEAETIYRRTVASLKKLLGGAHPTTLKGINSLARVVEHQGKLHEAEVLYRQTLAICEEVFGAEHQSILTSISNLVLVLYDQGRYIEADKMRKRILETRKKMLRADRPDTLTNMANFWSIYGSLGRSLEMKMTKKQGGANTDVVASTTENESSSIIATTEATSHALASTFHDSGFETLSSKYEPIPDDVVSESGSLRTKVLVNDIAPELKWSLLPDFVEQIVECVDLSGLPRLLEEDDGLEQVQDLLYDFSTILIQASSAVAHIKAAMFVRQQREDIASELLRAIGACGPNNTNQPTLSEKFAPIGAWRAGSYNVWMQPKDDMKIEQGYLAVGHSNIGSSMRARHLNSIEEQPHPRDIPTAGAFVLQGAEFSWLANRLQQLSSFYRTGSTFSRIRAQLVKTISGMSSTRSLVLSLEWNPASFLRRQFQQPQRLATTLVYCGSCDQPYVTTVGSYLSTMWPAVSEALLSCEEKLWSLTSNGSASASVREKNSNVASLNMILDQEITHIRISGRATTVLELAEAFVWISVACRENLGEDCVASCEPYLQFSSEKDINIKVSSTLSNINHRANTDGYCWLDMVYNPVIANGYPIPRRENIHKGLEVTFEVMVALSHTDWATRFDNTFLLKGVISALIPVMEIGASVIWHFVLNKDKRRLSYGQLCLPTDTALSHLTLGEIEHRRHFVGIWTTTANILAGSNNDRLYNFERSSSKPIDHYTASLSGLGMNVGKMLTVSASVVLARKDITPPLRSTDGKWFDLQIAHASNTTVLFYGQDDRRGWLLDGASALMHLSRAWLSMECYAQLIPREILKAIQYVEGHGGKEAAVQALMENKRRNICIFTDQERTWETVQTGGDSIKMASTSSKCNLVTSEWTFKHLVIEIWRTLEAMGDGLRSMKFAPPEVSMKKWSSKEILAGWEVRDLLLGERQLLPRGIELEPGGTDWLKYSREVSSVVLIARTFGELITPRNVVARACGRESEMPRGKDYLAVPLYIWEEKAKLENNGDHSSRSIQLTNYTYWNGFDPFYGSCTCADFFECNIVSHLGDKHMPDRTETSKRHIPLNVFNQYPQGVAIIGGPRKLQKRRPRVFHGLSARNISVNSTCAEGLEAQENEGSPLERLQIRKTSTEASTTLCKIASPLLDSSSRSHSLLSWSIDEGSTTAQSSTLNTDVSQELSTTYLQTPVEPTVHFTEPDSSQSDVKREAQAGRQRHAQRLARKPALAGSLRNAFHHPELIAHSLPTRPRTDDPRNADDIISRANGNVR